MGLSAAAEEEENKYKYKVEIKSGKLKTREIRGIFDLLFGLKGSLTSSGRLSLVNAKMSGDVCWSVIGNKDNSSEICGREACTMKVGDAWENKRKRPLGNKITVEDNEISYRTCT